MFHDYILRRNKKVDNNLTIFCRITKLFLLFIVIGFGAYSDETNASPKSEIIEINNINDVLEHATHGTMVLFDIDNTLLEPIQTLGSDQWFRWRLQQLKEQGHVHSIALEMALQDWTPIVTATQVKAVESTAPTCIKALQNDNAIIMGITTRASCLSHATYEQLKSINIQLHQTAPHSTQDVIFLNPLEVIYENGVLFTNGTNKGDAFFKFLALIKQQHPAAVLFINDKRSHLEEIQRACADKGVPFIGLRYGYLDKKVRALQEDIAEYQFQTFQTFQHCEHSQYFSRFLPDDEARKAIELRASHSIPPL